MLHIKNILFDISLKKGWIQKYQHELALVTSSFEAATLPVTHILAACKSFKAQIQEST